MRTQYFLDAAHAVHDLLTPILLRNRDVWSRNVEAVATANGEVLLRGTVGSFYHKQLAQEAFRLGPAISRVWNELRVVRPLSTR